MDFTRHLYIPEKDRITKVIHHEREDHNHILKRIAKHTREGGPPPLDGVRFKVQRYQEAMKSSKTDLNWAALSGQRKQSVRDAEKVHSPAVAAFFKEKGYLAEGRYAQVVSDWHEASDGRGLSQEKRKKANKNMKDYIMEDWMPWYDADKPDFSLIDIHRSVDWFLLVIQ